MRSVGDTISNFFYFCLFIGLLIGGVFWIIKSIKGAIESESLRRASNIFNEWQKNATEQMNTEIKKHQKDLADKIIDFNNNLLDLIKREKILKESVSKFEEEKLLQNKLFEEKGIACPWLAEQYALYKTAKYDQLSQFLETKNRPALKSADIVKMAKEEALESEKKYFMAKAILDYYEYVFPSIIDMREYVDELIEEKQSIDESRDPAERFLKKNEWNNLPTDEKFQRALDSYWSRNKSKVEIGRLYERFIGYEYENDGWDVTYFGAIKGLEDLGRDLIIQKQAMVYIIQCKNWSADKIIHEKHIFQLYGTCILYEAEHSKRPKGIFVTSCTLSETAKKCAGILGIQVVENKKLERFPCIKCNIAKDGEKIYHLPFDQQYDRIKISHKTGAFYCSTVAEAEKAGFRRAFRWHGNS